MLHTQVVLANWIGAGVVLHGVCFYGGMHTNLCVWEMS